MNLQDSTLCWECANFCGNCDWSAEGKPVKGWKAKRTLINNVDGFGKKRTDKSFNVFACPQFKSDKEQYNQPVKMTSAEVYEPNPIVREVLANRSPETEAKTTRKSEPRRRLEAMPQDELRKLIDERLRGHQRDAAILVLIGKKRMCDVECMLYYANGSLKKVMRQIYQKLVT